MQSPPSQSPVILAAQKLTRQFGGLVAVNNVSFTVTQGEIFGLIGPNGAGKTTTFNLMTGLIPASSGQMLHQGTDISRLRPFQIAQRGIARTFQNIRLFGNLSAFENVKIAHHLHTHSQLFQGILNLPPTPAEEREIRDRFGQFTQIIQKNVLEVAEFLQWNLEQFSLDITSRHRNRRRRFDLRLNLIAGIYNYELSLLPNLAIA